MPILIHSATDARNLALRSELGRTLDQLKALAEMVEEIADPRLPAKAEVSHLIRSLNVGIVKLRGQLQWDHPLQRAFRGELAAQQRTRPER
jgi:hypothetical protein